MPLLSYNDYLARRGNGYWAQRNVRVEQTAATTATALTGQQITLNRIGLVQTMESLPTGVTSYKLTGGSLLTSTASSFILAECVNLGSLDISTNVFTDGSTMPTKTEGNTSRTIDGMVFMEVTTALNATPGTITITYVDQNGNAAETTASQTLTASAAVGTVAMFPLNTPDTGVRDITAALRSAGTTPTGVVRFWGIIPIHIFSNQSIVTSETFNDLTGTPAPVTLSASSALHLFSTVTTAKGVLSSLFFMGDS